MEQKAIFVQNYLQPMLQSIERADIKSAVYTKDEASNECVAITFNNDYKINVNVSLDSELALVYDVMKALYKIL